jgi:hypothetical protein
MDAMLLYSETPNLHTHTLKVAIINAADYAGEYSFDEFRRTVVRRLHLLDPLRYKLVEIPWTSTTTSVASRYPAPAGGANLTR